MMFKRKGVGGQRPFEQCSKKLHFSYGMASLIRIKEDKPNTMAPIHRVSVSLPEGPRQPKQPLYFLFTSPSRCGFLNVFEFDEDDCQIDEMPEVRVEFCH